MILEESHAPNYNHSHILRLFNVLPILLAAQVKRSAIIGNKHGIYELPYELSIDLRLGS